MQRKRIARRGTPRERRISRDYLGDSDKVQCRRGQHGRMQRLADVASGFRPVRMLVQQAAARREVQQHSAGQHRENPVRPGASENSSTRFHDRPN